MTDFDLELLEQTWMLGHFRGDNYVPFADLGKLTETSPEVEAAIRSRCDFQLYEYTLAGLEAYGREPEGRFRLLLGYAGWGPGQLDEEIQSGAWLTAPVSGELVFDTAIGDMWKEAMRSLGVDPTRLVEGGTQLN